MTNPVTITAPPAGTTSPVPAAVRHLLEGLYGA